jgi:hypothetical protein
MPISPECKPRENTSEQDLISVIDTTRKREESNLDPVEGQNYMIDN